MGPVLATAVGRPRWMAGHLVFVVAGPVILLAMAGLVGGVINGGLVGNFGDGLMAALGAMLVQIPATLVLGGLAVALFGWLPRLTSLAWAALVLALLLGQLGQLLQLPQWLMDVSPYTHMPLVPAQDVRWTPLIVLTAVAAGLICRRDRWVPAPGRALIPPGRALIDAVSSRRSSRTAPPRAPGRGRGQPPGGPTPGPHPGRPRRRRSGTTPPPRTHRSVVRRRRRTSPPWHPSFAASAVAGCPNATPSSTPERPCSVFFSSSQRCC